VPRPTWIGSTALPGAAFRSVPRTRNFAIELLGPVAFLNGAPGILRLVGSVRRKALDSRFAVYCSPPSISIPVRPGEPGPNNSAQLCPRPGTSSEIRATESLNRGSHDDSSLWPPARPLGGETISRLGCFTSVVMEKEFLLEMFFPNEEISYTLGEPCSSPGLPAGKVGGTKLAPPSFARTQPTQGSTRQQRSGRECTRRNAT
jgi:hypothetical protein